ncbi:hypothetical protein AAIM60_06070, partial [Pseudomonas lijiangensis]|uniref:hypothetical protein n=1 Tax=Pseudomonas lijiangensis TaxID=2995658 RepID=UPI0031BA51DF
CVADNLLTSVLHHKHPHELLDSVVKERWVDSFVSTEARILQRPPYLSSGYFKKFQSFLCNFNHLRFDQLRVARQREANYTGPKGCVKRFLTPLPIKHQSKHFQLTPEPLNTCKLLIYKAFSVPSAPEVGRIIERLNRPSTVNFDFIEINRNGRFLHRRRTCRFYI